MKNSLNTKPSVKILSRAEQKAILGGKDIQFCFAQSASGELTLFNGESGNPEAAQASAQQTGGRWCCKSCDTASWFQQYIITNRG